MFALRLAEHEGRWESTHSDVRVSSHGAARAMRLIGAEFISRHDVLSDDARCRTGGSGRPSRSKRVEHDLTRGTV